MAGLIGRKLGMTQLFNEAGHLVPVTVIQAGPCSVVRKKTRERDGYESIQLGFEPVSDHKKKRKNPRMFRVLREFRVEDGAGFDAGQVLTVTLFKSSDIVHVVGTSKGRGFQGVMKRHGKAGGPASHGSRFHRTTGSIGQRTWPGEVFKNMKLPGHMGDERVTVRNLQVVGIREEDNLLLIRGAVPGCKNSLVLINRE